MSIRYLKNIAIAGASGVIGTPIIEHLVHAGRHNILALTRPDSKASFANGVKVAEVDYGDKDSLSTALKGQDVLLLCLSIATVHGVEKRLVDAAAEAGVQWIVPNEWSPDYTSNPAVAKDMLSAPRYFEMRQYIEDSGMLWTAQCSGFWYEHSLVGPQNFAFELDKKKVTFLDDGKTPVTVSTWNQCGRAIAALFSLPIQTSDGSPCLMDWKDRMHFCDSFFVSQRDMLDSWLRVTGQSESEWTIDYEPAEKRFKRGLRMLEERDMFGGPISVYGRLFMRDGAGDQRGKSENARLGLPKEDLDEATSRAFKMWEDGYAYNPFR